MSNAAIRHDELGPNDLLHGDEGLIEVLPLTKEQQAELLRVSDKLIDDAVTEPNSELIHQGLDCAIDELQDLLTIEHVPDIDHATMREILMLARTANKLLEAWYDGMLGVVAADAEKIVRGES